MSASTPPILNDEVRIPLPDECYVPLPASPDLPPEESPNESIPPIQQSQTETQLPAPLLELLLHAIQEDKYESRRLVVLQDEAHGLFHKCGSSERFLTVQSQLYRKMMDCFRTDKKTGFASLYAKAMSYPSFGELSMTSSITDVGSSFPGEAPWIEKLPSESSKALLDFLYQLRSDPAFVADRISRLSTSQLKNLVRLHRPSEVQPVFRGNQSQGRYDGRNMARPASRSSDTELSVDDLLADPLLLLVNGVFDNTLQDRSQQIDVWSSVCARLVEEGKPGADEFCLTVTNFLVDLSDWQLVPQLELFLAEFVSVGGPFLEAGGHNIKFTHPQQQRDPAIATAAFIEPYVSSLLDLLGQSTAPPEALKLIQSTLSKIQDPARRLTARNFFFLRWFCASFLANAIVFPENHGMLMDHHINNSIRQKVLRELALRVQSLISDLLSPWSSNRVSPKLEAKIQHMLAAFEDGPPVPVLPPIAPDADRSFLFLRPEDVLGMAKALSSTQPTSSRGTSLFEQPLSSASSLFHVQGQFMPVLADPSITSTMPGNSIHQSQTWHGARPQFSDPAFSTMNRSLHPSESSDQTLIDVEKDSGFSFLHDLWMLTAGREYHLPGRSRHEVAVVFVKQHSQRLSLHPFESNEQPPRQLDEHSQAISESDRRTLTFAAEVLAEDKSSMPQGESHLAHHLERVFVLKMRAARADLEFERELYWWQCLQIVQATDPADMTRFWTSFYSSRQQSVMRKRQLAKEYDEWLHVLRRKSTMQDECSSKLSISGRRLRNKMWYISDVRHSSAYEDTYNVVRALRAMTEPSEQRQGGVTAWAKQRFRSSFGQERVLAQTLELMTAPKTYGGPNKLSESQVEITAGWLLHENIENFCRGEERIHRFCYEVQKCVKRLAGEAMLDSPVLWSSPLYQSEKAEHVITAHPGSRQTQERPTWRTDFSYPQWQLSQASGLHGSFPGPEVVVPAATSPSAARTSFDRSTQSSLSPMLQQAPVVGGSHFPRNLTLPPSPMSPGLASSPNDRATIRKRTFLQDLRNHVTSLILSDLGSSLWNTGSETDGWITAMDSPTTRRGSMHSQQSIPGPTPAQANSRHPVSPVIATDDTFDFPGSYRGILRRFQLSSSPQRKLQYLQELMLLVSHARKRRDQNTPHVGLGLREMDNLRPPVLKDLGMGAGVPRTRLTRLQEVAANCQDRRLSSIAHSHSGLGFNKFLTALQTTDLDDPDLISAMQTIFEDPSYRPSTFFRDLQYIAAFVPSSTLDYSSQGTTFWTIGLAAMRIKAEKSKTMTENAMQILEYHYGNGNKKEPVRLDQSSPSTSSTSTRKLSQQDLLGTTLQDAARLLTISALEGDPAAARELALFHLTHPELVSRVTLPLSRPSDVFRAKHGAASDRGHRSGNGDESGVLDTVTFAVVFHWMEFAANAGDADAITFFKENKDLGKAL